MALPTVRRAKLHLTTPIERLNGEIERRIDIVSSSCNEATAVSLIGAILLEQSD
jgi:transposase-like protein